jgi:DNA-directed RNA polymerase specialized sigma24 family protein
MSRLRPRAIRSGATGLALWTVLAELPAPQRTAIERAYFGGLSHIQIGRALRVPSAA